ncbi:MAG: AAA family ATPase, partial [Oliverpabstia sp.]
MSNRIITISREFGSGGRTIGKEVAAKLGIHCYDSELIEKIAQESGLAKEFIAEKGEYASHGGWLANAFSYGSSYNGTSVQDYLWKVQREIILELAEKESCVIVGRCADYILRDHDNCLKVFIHAAADKRAERIVKIYGETMAAPEKRLQDKDKKRKAYYHFYTNMEWGEIQNYHITLDSGVLGIDKCVDIITDLY